MLIHHLASRSASDRRVVTKREEFTLPEVFNGLDPALPFREARDCPTEIIVDTSLERNRKLDCLGILGICDIPHGRNIWRIHFSDNLPGYQVHFKIMILFMPDFKGIDAVFVCEQEAKLFIFPERPARGQLKGMYFLVIG